MGTPASSSLCMFSLDFIGLVCSPLVMCLNVKVTLSLPLPGTVHHRDTSTKGAAVCLISPAEMGKRRRLGQPKVHGPSLTSIVLMETVVS